MPDQPTTRDSFNIRCADAIELVTEYLDDALDSNDLAAFEAHLAACDGCTIFVDQIRMTIQLTSVVGDQQVEVMPPDFDRLLAELRERAENQGR